MGKRINQENVEYLLGPLGISERRSASNNCDKKGGIVGTTGQRDSGNQGIGALNDFLPRAEKQFFKQPIREVLKQTEYKRRLWLHVAKRYIERDRQQVARIRAIRIMREWLRLGSTVEVMKN